MTEGIGNFILTIQDNDRRWHTIELPSSLYILMSQGTLLSMQHWTQVANNTHHIDNNTGYQRGTKNVTIWSDQRNFRKSRPLNW